MHKSGILTFPVLVIFALVGVLGAQGSLAQQTPASGTASVGTVREDGLYLTFETTLGDVSCKLFEKEAPLTVRTIVGLALGKQSYIDHRTKQKVTGKRFYDGLTFHRVIPRFMIQGGDPLGTWPR
jgi:peptidyl-prolyl cis-trans isomerase A (cyclophilin A)